MLKLVINLDRSPDRWAHAKAQLDRVGVDALRVSGVDGKLLDKDSIDANNETSSYPKKILCPRPLRAGEIGCFLSHRLCWQRLLDSDENWALILEDDIVLSDRAPIYMNSDDWIPEGIHLIQLFIFHDTWTAYCKRKSISLKTGDELLIPVRPAPTGTPAYMISREAAKFALEHSKTLPFPVDNYLFEWGPVAEKYDIWRLNNPVVRTTGEASTIHNNDRVRHKSPASLTKLMFQTKRSIAKSLAIKHEFKFS